MSKTNTILLAILSELQAIRGELAITLRARTIADENQATIEAMAAKLKSDFGDEIEVELDLDASLTDSVDIDTHINRIEDILKGEPWNEDDDEEIR